MSETSTPAEGSRHLPSELHSPRVPGKVSTDGLEETWGQRWEEEGAYAFDRDAQRHEVFSIDTPPPTVSGSLHVGHVFSYTHTDTIARYQRMRGKAVFYPMGWDDNGLPTERRVQNYFGVRCDPSLPYDPDFTPPHTGGEGKSVKARDQVPVSRRNFVELCERLTVEDEAQFEALWRRLGLSVDWSQTYQTIGPRARTVAQAAFLRNLARGEAYQAAAPGLWDVTFQTAVAQAELESREYPGFYHRLAFHVTDAQVAAQAAAAGAPVEDGPGGTRDVCIETTRPELLAACVALVAHPDDERYQPLFGATVTSPVFGVEVPVLAHPAAEMDKGAGIAMCCTFGDTTDIDWWRDLDLPLRAILRKDGRIETEVPQWITQEAGRQAYAAMAGKTAFSARQVVVEALTASGEMRGEPVRTVRQTNFFEKGDKPLEIVTSRQWYIRNGGRAWTNPASGRDLNAELLERGRELAFHPDFMRVRYENWVTGLNNDWLISRQRFFGVPFPVWYRVGADGQVDYDAVITPEESALPVDPSSDPAPGYTEDQRGVPGGFVGEVDIMDTWATSSLTPQLASGWLTDEDLFARVYPMDLRPQGQDIIRTWLFSSVVRANLEFGALPWASTGLSGWILDSDHKKMSKSKGNVVTPMGLLEQFGADAVRYWAASARLGLDAAFEESQIKIGRRLAIKILNASKFALSMGIPWDADEEARAAAPAPRLDASQVTEPLDRAVLAALADVVEAATTAFDSYGHARALEVTESFFWTFCDDYIELVKDRANDAEGTHTAGAVRSARTTLALAVDTFVRLLAPFLPYATEEVWSWYRTGSVHRSAWPEAAPLRQAAQGADPTLVSQAGTVLAALRRVKSEARTSQRTPILSAVLEVAADYEPAVEAVRSDLVEAAKVTGSFSVKVAGAVQGADVATEPVDSGIAAADSPDTGATGQDAEAGSSHGEVPVRVRSVELDEAPARPARSTT
ncbi:valine--tRNA ligase [Actinomyces sp. 2119]|uniref:valine--tRNA ligase n=1 Tax=Actinomyces sp. 2119 TaxID=2321393 RepID=UPI000E6B8537|nr:valine--tRNA ligase [Actinomyces sp. 2119]RJF43136.1 valine--tRNA ligase [Actinomyces sp. 2119]